MCNGSRAAALRVSANDGARLRNPHEIWQRRFCRRRRRHSCDGSFVLHASDGWQPRLRADFVSTLAPEVTGYRLLTTDAVSGPTPVVGAWKTISHSAVHENKSRIAARPVDNISDSHSTYHCGLHSCINPSHPRGAPAASSDRPLSAATRRRPRRPATTSRKRRRRRSMLNHPTLTTPRHLLNHPTLTTPRRRRRPTPNHSPRSPCSTPGLRASSPSTPTTPSTSRSH